MRSIKSFKLLRSVLKSLFIGLCLFAVFPVLAQLSQISQWGSPIIQSYSPKEYQSNPQNWAMVKDNRGIIYFGNDIEIVEFDGQHFRKIAFPKSTRIRSLAKDANGTIFYGSVGDFGFLKILPNGKVEPESLKKMLPKDAPTFNDVWNIAVTSYGTYFMSSEAIFVLHQGQIELVVGGRSSSTPHTILNDKVFYMGMDANIKMLDGKDISALPKPETPFSARVLLTTRGEHELLILPIANQFQSLDLSECWDATQKRYRISDSTPLRYQPILQELSAISPPNKAYFFRITRLPNGNYAIASARSGVFIMGPNGEFVRAINKNMGLIDNATEGVHVDGNLLWVTTNTGISNIEWRSGRSTFGERYGIEGMILTAHEYRGKLYVGTFSDLLVSQDFKYQLHSDTPKFKSVSSEVGEVWDFLEVDGKLLAASGFGLFQIDEQGNVKKVSGYSSISAMIQTPIHPDYLFVGGLGGMFILKKEQDTWKLVGDVKGFDKNISYLSTMNDGNILIHSDTFGAFLLKFTGKDPHHHDILPIQFDEQKIGMAPSDLRFIHGHLFVPTQKGIFEVKLHERNKVMEAEALPPRFLGEDFEKINHRPAIRIRPDAQNGFLIQYKDKLVWLRSQGEHYQLVTDLFVNTTDTDAMYQFSDGAIWMTGRELFRFDLNDYHNQTQSFTPLIRRVKLNQNESVFEGAFFDEKLKWLDQFMVTTSQQNKNKLEIFPYEKNSLIFEFAAPNYEKRGTTQFQYRLEGFDKHWSEPSFETYKEYTNIPEGKYRFIVKAIDILGHETISSEYAFQIKTPWYRTWWAYILWIALTALFLGIAIRIYTLRLRRDKMELERLVDERTQQIREMALTDPLTGLRNRRFISDILQVDLNAFLLYRNYLVANAGQHVRQGQDGSEVFGIFLLDMDKFKQVNDIYGHDAGDAVLKQLAQILTQSVRPDDVIIRLGGEEFLVVLKKTRADYLHEFARNILASVEAHPFDLGDGTIIRKTCSLGYTTFPFYASQFELLTFEQCIALSDIGMYKSKHEGRNRAHYIAPGLTIPADGDEVKKMCSSPEYGLKKGYFQFAKETRGPIKSNL